MSAIKFDQGKPRFDLLPVSALTEIAKVLTFGAAKYSENNWRSGSGFKWGRLSRAAIGHILSFISGEDKDPETGLSHLAHAGCCVLFLLEHVLVGLGQDDRHKYPVKQFQNPPLAPDYDEQTLADRGYKRRESDKVEVKYGNEPTRLVMHSDRE